MTIQQLPVFAPESHYTYQTSLDGVTYTLDFDWNARDGRWYMNISDGSGNLLRAGVPLLVGQNLFASAVDYALPPGMLEVVDLTGQDIDPGLSDFGQRVFLLYTPVADLPSTYVVFQ